MLVVVIAGYSARAAPAGGADARVSRSTGAWAGAARPDLARTALGNTVAISCHNCYRVSGEPPETVTARANQKIDAALQNGADLIEIDVAAIEGTLWATHDDGQVAGAWRPTLRSLLDNPRLRRSTAMLFIEVKEADGDPAAFAEQLASTLDHYPEYAAEGRPLFLRAFYGSRRYLESLRAAYKVRPPSAQLRYHVLFGASDSVDLARLHATIGELAQAEYTGVEIEYSSRNLAATLALARGLGLMTGVWTLPVDFGEVYVAALREEVDQLTADYRVDLVRQVVQDPTTVAYADAGDMEAAVLPIRQHLDVPLEVRVLLGLPGEGGRPGTPDPWLGGEPGPMFGAWLRFPPEGGRALTLWDVDARPGEGFLVSAVINLAGALGRLAPGENQAIVNKSEASGFALELYRATTGAALVRFGVKVEGGTGYIFHNYPIEGATTGEGPCGNRFTAPLDDVNTYRLVGAYDGGGGVYLFIDNRCPDTRRPTAQGRVMLNDVPIMVGADPPAESARMFFDGYIQSFNIQWWGDHTPTGDAANGTYIATKRPVVYLPVSHGR